METLDKCFENVCELDLIFHMDKVHFILNELVMGGMVLETNMNEILTRIEEQNKIEREEVRGQISCLLLIYDPVIFSIFSFSSISKKWQRYNSLLKSSYGRSQSSLSVSVKQTYT